MRYLVAEDKGEKTRVLSFTSHHINLSMRHYEQGPVQTIFLQKKEELHMTHVYTFWNYYCNVLSGTPVLKPSSQAEYIFIKAYNVFWILPKTIESVCLFVCVCGRGRGWRLIKLLDFHGSEAALNCLTIP